MNYQKEFMRWQELLDKQSDGIADLCLSGEECKYRNQNGSWVPHFVYARISEDDGNVREIFWARRFAEYFYPRHEILIRGDKAILGYRRQGKAFFTGFGFKDSVKRSLVLRMKIEGIRHQIYVGAEGSIFLNAPDA